MVALQSSLLMAEMTEVMRQRWHHIFIDLLNNIRVGQCLNVNKIQLHQRKINIKNSPPDATLICAENRPKDDYNISKLSKLNYTEIILKVIDVFGFANFTFLKTDWWSIIILKTYKRCTCSDHNKY